MARASDIRIVCGPNSGLPSKAFTVKHECISWLKSMQDIEGVTVTTVGDGLHGVLKRYRIPATQFIQEG